MCWESKEIYSVRRHNPMRIYRVYREWMHKSTAALTFMLGECAGDMRLACMYAVNAVI